jgi:single-stranded-DNA-specific exonuclease
VRYLHSVKKENLLHGLCFSWRKPSFTGNQSRGSLSELVLGSYGLDEIPSSELGGGDPLRKKAGEVAEFILQIPSGKAFVNADYDVDGTSAGAIIGGCLRSIGWDVQVFIPDRFEDSYGVNRQVIEDAWTQSRFELLVAADCGSTEMQWLGEFGKRTGCRVLVIDHHKKTEHDELGICELNPQNYLASGIHEYGYCTAVLASMVAEEIGKRGVKVDVGKYKILAGMAAMADVTAMDYPVGRHYAKCFLDSRAGECEALDALIEVSKSSRPLETSDALFKIIPMLNAAGRMRNATVLVALWDCDDYQECLRVASRLWALNRDRRRLQEEVARKASLNYGAGNRVLLNWHESWHPGVVGPAAGQLVERLGVPVFLGGFLPQKNYFSFSGRAPEGMDIHSLVSRNVGGLPVSFGGHKVALGMRVQLSDIECLNELRIRMEKDSPPATKPTRQLAGILKGSSVNYINYEDLRKLEPFGAGFPSPVFCVANLEILLSPMGGIADSASGVGKSGEGAVFPLVVFKNPKLSKLKKTKGHVVGEMVCSHTEGEKSIKLLVKDIIPTA